MGDALALLKIIGVILEPVKQLINRRSMSIALCLMKGVRKTGFLWIIAHYELKCQPINTLRLLSPKGDAERIGRGPSAVPSINLFCAPRIKAHKSSLQFRKNFDRENASCKDFFDQRLDGSS